MLLKVDNGADISEQLEFTVRATPIAQKWAECVRQASATSSLRERERWYNFPQHRNYDLNFIAERISACVEGLNRFFPGLILERLDFQKQQESINQIHRHFADTNHDQMFVTTETKGLWNDLNTWLHAYEATMGSQKSELAGSQPLSSIVATWHDNHRAPLGIEDYPHFTVGKKFGTCYVNYCQIGRHIYEMSLSKDDVASDEHIMPLRFVSADTYIWLGPTTPPDKLVVRQESIRKWFHDHSAKFNSLGFFWNDPMLAIGWLPVADLAREYRDSSEQRHLVQHLARMHQVVSMDILP